MFVPRNHMVKGLIKKNSLTLLPVLEFNLSGIRSWISVLRENALWLPELGKVL